VVKPKGKATRGSVAFSFGLIINHEICQRTTAPLNPEEMAEFMFLWKR